MQCNRIFQLFIFFCCNSSLRSINVQVNFAVVAVCVSEISVQYFPLQGLVKSILIGISENEDAQFFLGHKGNTGHKSIYSSRMRNNFSSAVFFQEPTQTVEREMT